MRLPSSVAFATALYLTVGAQATAATRLSGLSRCGPLAMQMCASICGVVIGGDDIDAHIEGDADGCTLLELQRVGRLLGLHTFALKYPRGLPYHQGPPAVLPIVNGEGRRHFVALAGCRQNLALVVDLPTGSVWLTEDQLRVI
jgi:hypothetical protein